MLGANDLLSSGGHTAPRAPPARMLRVLSARLQQARARRAGEPARARLRFTPRPSVPPRRARVCTFIRTAARRQGSASPGFGRRGSGPACLAARARATRGPTLECPVCADHQGGGTPTSSGSTSASAAPTWWSTSRGMRGGTPRPRRRRRGARGVPLRTAGAWRTRRAPGCPSRRSRSGCPSRRAA